MYAHCFYCALVQRTTKLYTQPHAEVAPFQRVWNPDTNSVYEDPNDWPGGDADDDEGITKDELYDTRALSSLYPISPLA
jgi:hypothetical protein